MAFFVRDLYGNEIETTFSEWAHSTPPLSIDEVHAQLDQLRREVHRKIDRDAHNAKRAIKYHADKARFILLPP